MVGYGAFLKIYNLHSGRAILRLVEMARTSDGQKWYCGDKEEHKWQHAKIQILITELGDYLCFQFPWTSFRSIYGVAL